MTFQLLPHYFKTIGLTLFVLFGLPTWSYHFWMGLTAGLNGSAQKFELPEIFLSPTFTIISYVGLILYALSKDKVFDELMEKVRFESLQLVFFGTLIFIIIRMLINGDWDMSASYLFEAQVIFFLVINKARKTILKFQL